MAKEKLYHSTHRCSFVELDPFGHMNTVHYLSHYLEHRFIGMREVSGLDLKAIHKLSIIFVTKDVKIDFIRPILGDEIFHITSRVTEMMEKDCRVECDMKNSHDQLLSKCQFTFTCVDKRTQKSAPWPDDIRTYFFD